MPLKHNEEEEEEEEEEIEVSRQLGKNCNLQRGWFLWTIFAIIYIQTIPALGHLNPTTYGAVLVIDQRDMTTAIDIVKYHNRCCLSPQRRSVLVSLRDND